jgi:hypothetical protein
MKIAILLPGHLRTWEYCKQNFIDKFIDERHQIDIFVDTYNEVESAYPTDRLDLYPKNKKLVLSNHEVFDLFSDLNVVMFNVESEEINRGFEQGPQAVKIEKCYKLFQDYVSVHGEYDLVIKSRFDILVEDKIDYNFFCENTLNNNFLFTSHIDINSQKFGFGRNYCDHLGIGNSDVMDKYLTRYSKFLRKYEVYHGSLDGLINEYNLHRSSDYIHSGLVRFNGDNYEIIW